MIPSLIEENIIKEITDYVEKYNKTATIKLIIPNAGEEVVIETNEINRQNDVSRCIKAARNTRLTFNKYIEELKAAAEKIAGRAVPLFGSSLYQNLCVAIKNSETNRDKYYQQAIELLENKFNQLFAENVNLTFIREFYLLTNQFNRLMFPNQLENEFESNFITLLRVQKYITEHPIIDEFTFRHFASQIECLKAKIKYLNEHKMDKTDITIAFSDIDRKTHLNWAIEMARLLSSTNNKDLQAQLLQQTNTIKEQSATISHQKSLIDQLKSERDRSQHGFELLQQEKTKLQTALDDSKSARDEIQQKLAISESALQAKQLILDEKIKSLEALEKQRIELENMHTAQTQQMTELTTKMTKLAGKLEKPNVLQKDQIELAKKDKEIELKDLTLAQQEGQIKAQEQENDALRKEYTGYKSAKQKELIVLREELERVNRDIASLRTELEKAKRDFQASDEDRKRLQSQIDKAAAQHSVNYHTKKPPHNGASGGSAVKPATNSLRPK